MLAAPVPKSTADPPRRHGRWRGRGADAAAGCPRLGAAVRARYAASNEFPMRPLPPLAPLDAFYEAAAAFSPFAAWLVPGKLLVGGYPFVDPSLCPTREQGERQMQRIIAAGVRTFVCLQAELPPQGEMRVGGVGGALPYKAVAELVAAAHTPPPPGDVINGVRNPTVDRFLPQRRRPPKREVSEYYAAERVTFQRWPVEEGDAPTQQQVSEILPHLRRRLVAGEAVYVHSRRGSGRAAAAGACLLSAAYGLTAEESLERVRRAWAARAGQGGAGAVLGGEGSANGADPAPITDEQREAVRRFAASLRGA